MKSGLREFEIIDSEQIWLSFSPEYQKHLLSSVKDYSYEAARWNAYLNSLCLNAFIYWIKEYLDLPEEILLLPSEKECYQLWEFLNGTAIKLGESRIILIPTEDSVVEEFCIQQEWVDIPGWEANYYVLIQVNPEQNWLRVLGYSSRNTIKEKGEYDEITRTYSLMRNHLTIDLNVMWMEAKIFPEKKISNLKLPKISQQQAQKLIGKLDNPLWCSPRLDFEFEHWAAILADANLRKLLYGLKLEESVSAKSHLSANSKQTKVNLSNWLKGLSEIPWQTFEEILGLKQANLAFRTRGYEFRQNQNVVQPMAIPALIELLHSETDEENLLKTAECLGTISPGHIEAIATLIELLNNSTNKWIRWEAIESLGEIATGNQQAATALSSILNDSKEGDLRWKAALSLGEIDPNHPKAGVGRCRKIDLGMQLDEHSVALLVYLMPETEDKVAVLLKVLPTGNDNCLPPNLELIVIDESEEVFEQATARNADNWIQLQFNYQAGDSFAVKVALGDVSHIEEFVS